MNWVDPGGLADDGINYWNKQKHTLFDGIPPARGHSDMYGNDKFDWTKEDHGLTQPRLRPQNHFRSYFESVRDILAAIEAGNKDSFERAMHRMQDVPYHYDKGYRAPLGHSVDSIKESLFDMSPDNDLDAWYKSNKRTKYFTDKWIKKHGCK